MQLWAITVATIATGFGLWVEWSLFVQGFGKWFTLVKFEREPR